MTAGPSSRAPPSSSRRVGRSRSPRSWRSGGRPRRGRARRGLVHPDGTIEGWVGGSCAQPVVVREALRSLADGQPRLLRLSKDAPAEGRRGDGVIELVMTCHSGGTLEIYVEPHLPAPVLWVAGTTPIAAALATLGAAAGWRVTVIDPVAETERLPDGPSVSWSARTSPGSTRTSTPYVVVATQGIWDEEAAALGAHPRRRVRRARRLADPGQGRARRGCARRPASPTSGSRRCGRRPGMDLGAETAEEVALSILAELVQVRRGRADFVARPDRPRSPGHRASRSRSSRSSTTSCCSTRSAG